MIEVYTDFLSDSDSNEFIEYYKMGLENEVERQNKKGAYKFNYVDNFEGGELVLDNMTIKPKRNQMFIVPGTTPHYVKNVISGDRYSLVLFLDNKLRIKKNCL